MMFHTRGSFGGLSYYVIPVTFDKRLFHYVREMPLLITHHHHHHPLLLVMGYRLYSSSILCSSEEHIQASALAFAAIRRDGTVVTWGTPHAGGDSSHVQEHRALGGCLKSRSTWDRWHVWTFSVKLKEAQEA